LKVFRNIATLYHEKDIKNMPIASSFCLFRHMVQQLALGFFIVMNEPATPKQRNYLRILTGRQWNDPCLTKEFATAKIKALKSVSTKKVRVQE
jgi:hypothetical protein